jgi:hypothetical protein
MPGKPKHASKRVVSRYLASNREELQKYLPTAGPGPLRAVWWCDFDCRLDLPGMLAALRPMPELKWAILSDSTRGPVLQGHSPYPSIVFLFYAKKKRWRLEVLFRQQGTRWGSNEALYRRFKNEALPRLRATAIEELSGVTTA